MSAIINDVMGSVKERAFNPIMGSYFIFLLIFNWKFFVVLFTSHHTGSKLVENLVNIDKWSNFSFILPFFISVSLLYVSNFLLFFLEIMKIKFLFLERKHRIMGDRNTKLLEKEFDKKSLEFYEFLVNEFRGSGGGVELPKIDRDSILNKYQDFCKLQGVETSKWGS